MGSRGEKRGLPNEKITPHALKALIADKALNLFEKYKVLSNAELKSRYLIHVERYIKDLEIEVNCLNNICMTQVLPAAVAYQQKVAKAITSSREALGAGAVVSEQKEILKKILRLIDQICKTIHDIQSKVEAASAVHDEPKKAEMLGSKVKPKMDELREYVDALENMVDDESWPLPKFWEMLFIS